MFFKGFICGFVFAFCFAVIWAIAKKLYTNRNGVQPDNPQYDDCTKSVDGLSDTIDRVRNTIKDTQDSINNTIELLGKIKERQ